ncbi:MAG TPA: hypothetical protein VGC76_07060 [Pyrinomonadaceae bacterium]|jgi:hypothetical protein
MLKGNKCELCSEVIQSTKAQHKQTKYCQRCAQQKKIENTQNSWLPEEKRAYMRQYMRNYRRLHPKLNSRYVRKHRQKKREVPAIANCKENSTITKPIYQKKIYFSCLWFMPLLVGESPSSESMSMWFDSLETAIKFLELAAVKISGLIIIVLVCVRHIKYLLYSEDNDNRNENSNNSDSDNSKTTNTGEK